MNMKDNKKGFTLIELIIVIAIIAILAAAVFVAIDPTRRFNESRNARRSSDIATILEAVKKNQADNGGTLYTTIDSLTEDLYYTIGTCTTGGNSDCTAQTTQASCVDLSSMPTNYLATVPQDPSTGSEAKTDYYLMKDSNGAITVGACDSEGAGAGGGGAAPTLELVR